MNREAFFALFDTPYGAAKFGCEIFAVSFLLTCFCVAPAMFRVRRVSGAHWTERARYLYQVGKILRVQKLYNLISAGVLVAMYASFYTEGRTVLRCVCLMFCAYFGSSLTHYFIARKVFPELRNPRIWLQQRMLAFSPFIFIFSICFGITWGLHSVFGARYATAAVIAWFSMYALNILGGWVLPLRLFGLTRTPTPRIRGIVDAVAARMTVNRPVNIVLVKGVFPYAAALPTASTLIFSTGILELLTDEELDAITAHEIMHLTESGAQKSMRYLPSLFLVPLFILVADRYSDNFLWVLYGYIAFLLVFGRVMRVISRKLEQRADAGAAAQEQNQGVYARALEKLYERNLVPASIPKRNQTHPDLYDRLIAAGATPSYSRPAAPPRREFWFCVLVNTCLIVTLFVVFVPELVRLAFYQ